MRLSLLAAFALGWLLTALLFGCAEQPTDDCEREVRIQVEQIRKGADPDMPMPQACASMTDEQLLQIVQEIYEDYR